MIEQIIPTKSEHEFVELAAAHIFEKIMKFIKVGATCRLGLAGGSTPKKVYHHLAEMHVPWGKLFVVSLDERNIPISDKRSNVGMIRDELTGIVKIPREQVIYFDTSLGYDSAVLSTEQKLIGLKKAREPLFDHVVLGVGFDGHIASIFPGTPASQKGFLTMKTSTDTFDVSERMTLTMEALTSAKSATILLAGHEKYHILHAMMSGSGLIEGNNNLPVMEFIHKVPTVVFTVNM